MGDLVDAAIAARNAQAGNGDSDGNFTTKGATEAPKVFRVDGEEFYVAPVLPGGVMELIAKFADATGMERIRVIGEFLEAVLLPDSAARYLERFSSAERPITIEEAGAHVIHIVRNVYGVTRPLGQPSSSPAG